VAGDANVLGRPPPRLQGRALRYVGYRESSGQPVRRREVPTGAVTLILNLGPRMRVATPAAETATAVTSFVAGLHDGPALTEHDGEQAGLQVDLTPLGAYSLLGVPMHELTNRVVELDAVIGSRAGHLMEQLGAARRWEERFALVDELLGAAVATGPRPSPEVAWMWHQLALAGGTGSIAALAEEVGWSRRHLVARFRREVGVSPKTMARVLRFHRAVREMTTSGDRTSLAEVAATCGYYDQAHFNREFRQLAGCTPSQHLVAAGAG
jgi:AraC-like DNA-binding protein